ncbi:protein kinase domain-containing protein [Legionella cardiaca]|uniref:Protein kinase n=1 Tax=Legionella cardiaca TaxID=1071983 RepID=A0ABY8AU46_9GAMM|nr:protein kinase [Legionella cardiaca]WED42906.1 protein kinase [Legionella cardiaca]
MKLINSTNPKKKHLPLLQALFQQADDSRQGFGESKFYYVNYKNKKIKVALTHTIIKRQSKKGGNRYEVIDSTPLGKGSYGVVYPIKATIKIAEETLVVKHKAHGKRRVVKQRLHSTKTMDEAVNEYIITHMTPHSHPKYPVVYGHHIYSVSRRMEGRELFDIINDDFLHKQELTLKQRFELSIRLIEALQTQVFDAGLVHRDLKPENIIVDMDEGLVGTIDFGLAKIGEGYVNNDAVGSPLYVSPEVFQGSGTTQLSDVYGLGRILALLWRVDLTSYDTNLTASQLYTNAKKNNYSNLFVGIKSTLEPEVALIIQEIIEGMTAFNPKNRLDLKGALTKFHTAQNLQFPKSTTNAIINVSADEDSMPFNTNTIKIAKNEPTPNPPKKTKKWGLFFKASKKEELSMLPKEEEKKPGKSDIY